MSIYNCQKITKIILSPIKHVDQSYSFSIVTWHEFALGWSLETSSVIYRLDVKPELWLQRVNELRGNMIIWPVTPLRWLMISLIWWIALYPDIQVIFWEKPLFTLTVERCLGQAPMDNLYQSMPDKPIPATSSPIDRFLLQCPKTTSSLKTYHNQFFSFFWQILKANSTTKITLKWILNVKRTRSQMLRSTRWNLPAQIWRLVGCTETVSRYP